MTFVQPVVLLGIGEMGGVFARALLRSGSPVFPVRRHDDLGTAAAAVPSPSLVLVTVGEDDLDPVLSNMPAPWRSRVGLIQNELLPRSWEPHGISDPTVGAVWFEKKAGRPVTVIIPSPFAGPAAGMLASALVSIGIAAFEVDRGDLLSHLIAKNCYILTANIAGLRVGGNVGALWNQHRRLADAIVEDVLVIQEALVGAAVDRERAIAGMAEAFAGDPDHGTTGRSAPRRLQRALDQAAAAGLDVPALRAIGQEQGLVV